RGLERAVGGTGERASVEPQRLAGLATQVQLIAGFVPLLGPIAARVAAARVERAAARAPEQTVGESSRLTRLPLQIGAVTILGSGGHAVAAGRALAGVEAAIGCALERAGIEAQ